METMNDFGSALLAILAVRIEHATVTEDLSDREKAVVSTAYSDVIGVVANMMCDDDEQAAAMVTETILLAVGRVPPPIVVERILERSRQMVDAVKNAPDDEDDPT
jgi:hypothetical protein